MVDFAELKANTFEVKLATFDLCSSVRGCIKMFDRVAKLKNI